MSKNVSLKEMVKIIESGYFASCKDIQAIGCVGESKALEVKRDIRNKLAGKLSLPRDRVPMIEVIKYFGIDLNYIGAILGKKIMLMEDTNNE